MKTLDLGELGLTLGGHLLLDKALTNLRSGESLQVTGKDPALSVYLRVWARHQGHIFDDDGDRLVVTRGDVAERRWRDAERAGQVASPAEVAHSRWGLAARGALVESGGPDLTGADLDRRDGVWTDLAAKLYAQAAAGQWDPVSAIDWTPPDLPTDVEITVVQTMTYLVENEQAALVVPARFLGRIHPHFREVIAFLATQIADEARHVHVFARRAELGGLPLGISGAGGRASLQSLLDEPAWTNASFLLSVLGEGSFLSLLAFLKRHAPDDVTARIAHLALADEARHVAFAIGHLAEHVTDNARNRDRLRAALERRHDTLATTAGLSSAVHDSLVVLAAGAWDAAAIQNGWDAVQVLQSEMDEGRRRRLVRLGFSDHEASDLAMLHTSNFM